MTFPIPANEVGRLAALARYNIPHEREAAFDDIAELAAQISGAAFAMVNIIDSDTARIKARHGVPAEITVVPRGAVCCSHTLCASDLMVCPNTIEDARFRDLPFIATEPNVRFYAGMPLINSGGYALGTLCIMDMKPRELDFETSEAIRRLARQAVAQLELRLKLREVESARQQAAEEKLRADDLIRHILPAGIAAELAASGRVEPRHHPSVTIMFTDFVDFTRHASQSSPRALIDDLDRYFSEFDEIIRRHGLEKLKTIGDAYMCAGGLVSESRSHAADTCLAALEIREAMDRANEQRQRLGQQPWRIRIGIHTGSVMSGVVGRDKFTYDIWGDAVNVAARIEQAGAPGRINLSESTFQHVKAWFDCEVRGSVEAKNKGAIPMHFLNRIAPAYAADPAGTQPNDLMRAGLGGAVSSWSLGAVPVTSPA